MFTRSLLTLVSTLVHFFFFYLHYVGRVEIRDVGTDRNRFLPLAIESLNRRRVPFSLHSIPFVVANFLAHKPTSRERVTAERHRGKRLFCSLS